jgi:hypothetical protein
LAYSSDTLFQLSVIYKSYWQVLTHVNNSQLLLKLEILDNLRLVTLHKWQHKESATLKLVHTSSGEMRVLMTLIHKVLKWRRSSPSTLHFYDAAKLWHFIATLWINLIIPLVWFLTGSSIGWSGSFFWSGTEIRMTSPVCSRSVVPSRWQCCKTIHVRNLQNKWVFVQGKSFQPSLMFEG